MANRKRPHFVGVWLSDVGRQALDECRAREGLSQSDTVRLMLAYAVQNMPKGWRP